ncbi:MAG: dienelactone hydrolase family protein [Myxococcota bacterium]
MPASDHDVTRREFLVSSALVAGYAIAAEPVFASAIHTEEAGLETGDVSIPVAGGSMAAYYAAPASGDTPPVALVVHEIFGVHEYIRDVCRRLAKEGYLAIAPDLYQRQGDVSKQTSVGKILEEIVVKVPDEQVLADLDATLAWAKDHGKGDTSRVVITGFCWGGRIVWLYCAHNPTLKAGAAWYGRLAGEKRPETPTHPLDVADAPHAPILGLYGTEDSGISIESVQQMRARLAASGSSSEIALFPGAPHGFHADYRASYRPMAATEGWRRMLDWFRMQRAYPVKE